MIKDRVQKQTAAGKLTNRRSPCALLRSLIPTCLVFLVTLGIAATPALASETFGVEAPFESKIVSNEAGALATQAGSHPYAITTAIVFNHVVTAIEEEEP